TVEALEAFRRLRRMLAEEYGLDPSPALRRLESEILRGSAVPVLPTTPRHPGTRLTSFVGREADLAELDRVLAGTRLVTLTGTGGAGKSRLAGELADRVADRFPDGVRTVELAPARDGIAVVDAFAREAGVLRQGVTPLADTLVAALRPRRVLLVVDNCEHVLDEVAALVGRLVRDCPRVSVLATSRQRLAVAGEHLRPVAPLAVPADGCTTPDAVGRVASVRLFADRASAADPTFRLDDGTAGPVARICRRLDGLPLAIELAAARVTALRPADLALRLDTRFGLLTGGPRDDTGRHRTLRATIDWSYELLDPAEAALFVRLSVFRGGFDLVAAESVCGSGSGDGAGRAVTAGLLAALVDKSMVVAAPSGTRSRFRLLETLRDHGAELADPEERGRVERAHAAFFVHLAEAADGDVRGREEARGVATIACDLPNLRAAQRWAVRAGEADLALRLSAALHFYAIHRLHDEVLCWGVDAAELPAAEGHPLRASVLASAGFGAAHRGERETARELARRGLAVASDETGRADVLETLAAVDIYEGELADSRRHGTAAADAARRCGDAYRAQWSSHVAALAATYAGDPDAPALIEAVVAGARALGNPSQLAWAAYLQGEAVLDRDPRSAADLLDEAVALAAPVDSHFVHGVSLVSACSARGRSSDPHAAIAPFRDAIDHWSRAGDRTHQWTTLRNLVEVLARTGADEAAAVVLAAGAASPGAPPVYGVGAERLARAERSLRQRLGPARFIRARERGRGLDDDAVVAFALEVLDGLGAPSSPAGRVLDREQVVDQPGDEAAAVEAVPDLDERPQLATDELADRPGVARPDRPDGGGDPP
ncbi:MAG TPA: BTAD domain-containing putative transcriptional regulator, partial [Actinomycetospora sp.]|nr:BTAD domain-containing putative transcriptional regulator [Actinomycetospora sp.]